MTHETEVVELYRVIARCPQCDSDYWEVLVDKPGDFDNIIGLVCSQCEMRIDFKLGIINNDSDTDGSRKRRSRRRRSRA